MDAVEKAKSGHPGMPMGMADVATVLFTRFLKFDAAAPDWPDRDRFVLSAGHGSMLLYALLYLTGYPGMTMDELKNFRQLGSKTAGHPEHGHAPGIETTTGPLGQGLANAVGMALAERLLNARLGDGIVDHYTYVFVGDGCLMEGISHEAISLAGHLRLNRLIVLFDDNQISIDGPTSLSVSDDQIKRFEAAGWATPRVDGHDPEADRRCHRAGTALRQADADRLPRPSSATARRPSRARRRRTARRWAPTRSPARATSSAGRIRRSRFRPTSCTAWRAGGARGAARAQGLEQALARPRRRKPRGSRASRACRRPGHRRRRSPPPSRPTFAATPPKKATARLAEAMLDQLVPALPALIGGSADLTGSNSTRIKHQPVVSPGDFAGSYIHYGVREHAMAAAMNGMALHGGIIPYGGTFLVFTDYCRPAIRLSALMRQRVDLRHDARLHRPRRGRPDAPAGRAPGRPAGHPQPQRVPPGRRRRDGRMLGAGAGTGDTPSILALDAPGRANLRTAARGREPVRQGRLRAGRRRPARRATSRCWRPARRSASRWKRGALLAKDGIEAAVVSMPCWELFAAQPVAYREAVLGRAPRVAVEAAVGFGWERWLGEGGVFVGMDGFGASAPAAKLYEHFGITPARVADAARRLLGR